MIPALDTIVLFIPASILLIIAPGPDLIFTFTQGLAGGQRAGVITALGFAAGNIIHTLGVAIGISAVISASATAFTVMKFCGAGYLFYLAWKSFIHRKDGIASDIAADSAAKNVFSLFSKAFIMNILNPKVVIFFIAFFPQFIDLSGKHAFSQTLFLGLTFIGMTAVIFSLIGFFAGSVRKFLEHHSRLPEFINIGAASVFLFIGIRIATYSF